MKTITLNLHKEEAIAIVEAIPPDTLDDTLEDYILMADRILRSVRVSERDALSELFGRLDGFEQTFRQAMGELGKSQRRGALGEEEVLLDLNSAFGPADRFIRVSTTGYAGDIQGLLGNGEIVLIEVKNYTRSVPTAEVDKFWRDMRERNHTYGVFVSLQTPISGMPTENFAYRQEGPRRGVFVVNTAFDNVGHRMAIEYIKRLIELERLCRAAVSRADTQAAAARIGDELHTLRDTMNLATEVRKLAHDTTQAVQSNMTQAIERVIELQARVRIGLENIDRSLRYLADQEATEAEGANDEWVAIVDLLPQDNKLAEALRTLCAGLVGHRLTFRPAGEQDYALLYADREVGRLEVRSSRLTVLTNQQPAGPQADAVWKPAKEAAAGKEAVYGWKCDFRTASAVREYVTALAQLLTGQTMASPPEALEPET